MSAKVLSDNGYTTVFGPHKEGVAVYNTQDNQLTSSKPPVIQGWHNALGLWSVPIGNKPPLHSSDLASNIYELLSTPKTI